MTEATKTAAPRRRTPGTRTNTPKAAPTKATETPAQAEEGTETAKVSFELEKVDETKTYAVFSPAKNTGCVGKLYVPKGTETVKVLLVGPAEVIG